MIDGLTGWQAKFFVGFFESSRGRSAAWRLLTDRRRGPELTCAARPVTLFRPSAPRPIAVVPGARLGLRPACTGRAQPARRPVQSGRRGRGSREHEERRSRTAGSSVVLAVILQYLCMLYVYTGTAGCCMRASSKTAIAVNPTIHPLRTTQSSAACTPSPRTPTTHRSGCLSVVVGLAGWMGWMMLLVWTTTTPR